MKTNAEKQPKHTLRLFLKRRILFFAHIRIIHRTGRYEGFFRRSRAGPADEVQNGARFVVGTRSTGAAERLLTNNCAGRFVVDVEVAGCVFQRFFHFDERCAVLTPDCTGQCISGSGVAGFEGFIQFVVVVNVDGKDRPKDFFDHRFEVGVFATMTVGCTK